MADSYLSSLDSDELKKEYEKARKITFAIGACIAVALIIALIMLIVYLAGTSLDIVEFDSGIVNE